MFKNDLQMYSKFEDQFNFIDSPAFKIVIYNSNSNLYLANCKTIKGIKVPGKVDKCSQDLPVITADENKIVYLTKQEILRQYSDFKECTDKYEFFETNNITIVRQSNLITIIQKKSKKLKYYYYDEKKNLTQIQTFMKNFLDFYRKKLSINENFLIGRDFIIMIFTIIIVIVILIKSKQPVKDLICFFLLIIKNFKNKPFNHDDINTFNKVKLNKKIEPSSNQLEPKLAK